MKKIIVKWFETNNESIFRQELRVISSDSHRYVKGSRFDFGKLTLATAEGYTVEVQPN